MEILVSEFSITEKSVHESGHTKTHSRKETPGERGRHMDTHITNMYGNV